AKVVLAHMNIARGEDSAASDLLDEAFQTARQYAYTHQLSHIAEAQARIRIRQGRLKDAMRLAQPYHLPFSMTHIHLAAGDFTKAIDELEKVRVHAEKRDQQDIRLKTLVLQAISYQAQRDLPKA